jgi:hypothetical protein
MDLRGLAAKKRVKNVGIPESTSGKARGADHRVEVAE